MASDDLVMPSNNMASKMFTIPALIRLLYSTGMRKSEAISAEQRCEPSDRSDTGQENEEPTAAHHPDLSIAENRTAPVYPLPEHDATFRYRC